MSNIPEGQSQLDSIRQSKGNEACAAFFADTCKSNVQKGLALLMDPRLTYPCFFILMPHIESYRLYQYLDPTAQKAYIIASDIMKSDEGVRGSMLKTKNNAERAALKWMLGTGYNDTVNGVYDAVLDVAASVLINLYGDKSAMPLAADMLFSRGRQGRNIHDLAWAMFHSRDPEALKLVAQHMDSASDSELAGNLLGINKAGRTGSDYINWLNDNDPYLYFTDDSFQFKSKPAFYSVDLESKYLQHSATDTGESEALAVFRQLGDDERTILSDYSHSLRGDPQKWSAWMQLPVDEQLKEARQSRGEVWL